MAKRKSSSRIDLSVREKVAKLDAYHALPAAIKKSQQAAAAAVGTSRTTLTRMLAQEKELRQNEKGDQKRNRTGKDADVEDALFKWWKMTLERQIPLNGKLLCEKANSIAEKAGHSEFQATDGWFSRWKARNGIVFTKLAGEAAEANVPAAKSFISDVLPELLRTYEPRNILNADETGIYFRALPSTTFIEKKNKKGAKGFKTAKDRITCLVTCAMDGSKEDLLLIGKSKAPRCFKNIKKLPLPYDSSANAWMTGTIWERWLRRLDSKMVQQGRHVLLLIDNCSAHVDVAGLKNVKVQFLPANTTSILQPCDQGVIRTLKAYFRTALRRSIIDAIDGNEERGPEVVKKLTVLNAMEMLDDAWTKVTDQTIKNCFQKGGFTLEAPERSADQDASDDVPPPPGMTEEDFNDWVQIDDDAVIAEEASLEEVEDNLAMAIKEKDEAVEEDEEELEDELEPAPGASEMRAALDVLHRGLQEADLPVFDEFWRMEKIIKEQLAEKFPPKQTTLHMFFRKP